MNAASRQRKTVNILGVTGSVGQAAADVIRANPDYFDVQLVTAHSNEDELKRLAQDLGARETLLSGTDGDKALENAAAMAADITLTAVVGMAGLAPLMQAIKNSKAVAIANKEPLVSAGKLVMETARANDTTLLPVDSEHNAVFQVFDAERKDAITGITLTASGGPFRTYSAEQLQSVTLEEALDHPTWSMGPKISIDSATMMNKALEIIEACHLFALPPEKVNVLVHPQSLVHALVEYSDGSVLAQMGASDMRTPIANALGWPERIKTPGKTLDLQCLARLDFEPPDHERFPALQMVYDCLKKGHAACIALNAANEIAVELFLTHRIGFCDIIRIVQDVLKELDKTINDSPALETLDEILTFDKKVRHIVYARYDVPEHDMSKHYTGKRATTQAV